jgi:iron complex transport system substrate-binding protein
MHRNALRSANNSESTPPGWASPRMKPRIVSLLPSATEVLCLLGGEHLLVGRSHECDYPPSVAVVPVLTAPRIPPEASPAETDRAVSEALGAGQSLYTLDEQALADLRPDLILTQDLCAVCSIDLAAVQRAAAAIPSRPRVLSLNPRTIDAVLDDLLAVGEAAGLDPAPAVARLRERFFAAEEYINPYADPPSVAFLEWTDPLFCAGHWTVQLIERAGAAHPLSPTVPDPCAGAAAGPQRSQRSAPPSRRITPEELVASAPEWLVIAPCGLDLMRTRETARVLAREPWWKALPAVQRGRVALVDGNQMFNRPGPRLAEAFEWLVGWLNDRPELIPEGFQWEPFS